jgi:hypothetical protein
MADEITTGLAPEVAETNAPVETPKVKKTRAPRQKKIDAAPAEVAAEVVTTPAVKPAKKAAPGRGKKAKPAEPAPEVVAKAKATRMKRTPRAAATQASAPVTAANEMEDLIKLEDENKGLRKLLSEKLRAENADLRKRLGQA